MSHRRFRISKKAKTSQKSLDTISKYINRTLVIDKSPEGYIVREDPPDLAPLAAGLSLNELKAFIWGLSEMLSYKLNSKTNIK